MATTQRQNQAEWTILYHGGGKALKGRGEFLRLMLEDAGVEYDYVGDGLTGPEGVMDCFRGGADAVLALDNAPFPVFFPPAIVHRPLGVGEVVCINQVAACMAYMGDRLGYAPATAAERARSDCIAQNALDYISEGRSSFHPVKNAMSYHDQKEEGDRVSKEFTKDRMLTWLAHFEKVVKRNDDATSPVAGGANITYADFCLFHVLDATEAQFNTEFYGRAWDKSNVPSLKAYHAWMKTSRPNLKKYFASDRCCAWAGDSMM